MAVSYDDCRRVTRNLGTVAGRCVVTYNFPDVPLLDGTYAVTIGVHTRGGLVYDSWEQLRRFEVAAPGRDIGLVRLPVAIEVDGREVASDWVATQTGDRGR